jgi:hypothetical protein
MAEIAVRRKPVIPVWAWLLIGLALIALLWAFFGRDRGWLGGADRYRAGAIDDLALLYNVSNPDSLVGREVRIDNAKVLSVTGDRHFWVGDREGRQVLVMLDETATPGQPRIEGRYDVNPGQTIAITDGEVKRVPAWDEARSRWNIDENLRSNFENQRVYVEAKKLEIKDWRSGQEPVQTQPR